MGPRYLLRAEDKYWLGQISLHVTPFSPEHSLYNMEQTSRGVWLDEGICHSVEIRGRIWADDTHWRKHVMSLHD
jgi:hypothetical protein